MANAAGEAHLDAARKHLKKPLFGSLFAHKPNYEAAAEEYEAAAKCFRDAGDTDRALQCYVDCAENWALAGSAFQAAKHTAAAALLASKAASVASPAGPLFYALRSADLYAKASEHYLLCQNDDIAAETMCKAARALEPVDPARALAAHRRAIELYTLEGRYRLAMDPVRAAISFAIACDLPRDVIDLIQLMHTTAVSAKNKYAASKVLLSLLIYNLHLGDLVAAQELMLGGAPLERDERELADLLISAFENGDPSLLERAQKHVISGFLDPPAISNVLRTLVVHGAAAPSSSTAQGASRSAVNIPIPTNISQADYDFQSPMPPSSSSSAAAASTPNSFEQHNEEDLC